MISQRQVGFQFQANWFDSDLIQLRISAWNGTFGGTADIYEAIGDLEEAAAQLRGFPRDPSDRRELIFGNFDRKCAGGGVRMRFHCIGGAGHSYVEATIDSNSESAGTIQTAVLSISVEAAAIDVFVRELEAVGANRAGTAFLKVMEPTAAR
jgi:hypothetical protein